MNQKTYLHIAEPCHENWDIMTPVQQGRFCDSCCKQVVDFSRMSDDQILTTLSKAAGKTCGRFADDQLQRPLQEQHSPFIPKFSYKYIHHLMVTSLLTIGNGYAQPKPKKTTCPATVAEDYLKGEVATMGDTVILKNPPGVSIKALQQQQVNQSMMLGKVSYSNIQKHFVDGVVMDENGTPVGGVTVQVNGFKQQVKTNEDGSFNIKEYKGNNAELIVTADDYNPSKIKAVRGEYLTIKLETKHRTILTGDVMVVSNETISGKVLNEKGEALPFATITVNERQEIIANEEGIFSLEIPPFNDVSLEVTYAGYEPSLKAFKKLSSSKDLVIKLKTNNHLPDVTMVAYSTQQNLQGMVGGLSIVRTTTIVDTAKTFIDKVFRNELFKLLPNPIRRGHDLQIFFKKQGEYELVIFDNNGKLYKQTQFKIANEKSIETIGLPASLSAGNYYIRAINLKTKKQFVDKLIVQ